MQGCKKGQKRNQGCVRNRFIKDYFSKNNNFSILVWYILSNYVKICKIEFSLRNQTFKFY